MASDEVTIRELRNHGGEVVDRVERGGRVVITRAGRPVAELRALPRPGRTASSLIERRRHLPPVDVERLRQDVDQVLDAGL